VTSAAGGGHALRRHERAAAHLRAGTEVKVPAPVTFAGNISEALAIFSAREVGKGNPEDIKIERKKPDYHVHVPKEDVDAFVASLTTPCGKQVRDVLNGGKESFNTFVPAVNCQINDGTAATTMSCKLGAEKSKCKKFFGELCGAKAVVQHHPEGSDIASHADVSGETCVPDACIHECDLTTIGDFIHKKTIEHIPGTSIQVALSFDCSDAGGAKYPPPGHVPAHIEDAEKYKKYQAEAAEKYKAAAAASGDSSSGSGSGSGSDCGSGGDCGSGSGSKHEASGAGASAAKHGHGTDGSHAGAAGKGGTLPEGAEEGKNQTNQTNATNTTDERAAAAPLSSLVLVAALLIGSWLL